MMMRMMLVTASLLAALLTVSVQAAENSSTEEENMLLSLVLKRSSADGSYTVITPEVSLEGNIKSPQDKESLKRSLTAGGKIDTAVVSQLIDKLVQRNEKPVRLSLKSAPKNGYIVDYDGSYAKYFEKDGGGWEAWHKEHPQAHGSTTVSLPAYDQKSGLVLVYKGQQFDYLAGTGLIILYKFDNGELKELTNIMLWIS